MGWSRNLTARALALGLLLQAAVAPAQLASDPNTRAAEPELSKEEIALLEELDLLMQLEMLRDWDPDEELPIPASVQRVPR